MQSTQGGIKSTMNFLLANDLISEEYIAVDWQPQDNQNINQSEFDKCEKAVHNKSLPSFLIW